MITNHYPLQVWPNASERRLCSKFTLGPRDLDRLLGGGLTLGAIHEIYTSSCISAAALTGFGIATAKRAAQGKPFIWIKKVGHDDEHGDLHPCGLASLGFDPCGIFVAQARSIESILRSAIEAVRCTALGAVVVDIHGPSRVIDLTASRRLAIAAERSGVPIIILRVNAPPTPSAATTRWSVLPLPSAALAANAPGRAAFQLTLLKHKGGIDGLQWEVEWNHETQSFEERHAKATPLPRTLVAFATPRSVAARAEPLRRVG